MEERHEPGAREFFVRIINSIAYTLMWMLACVTAGIYFKLGYVHGQPVLYPIIFYSLALITFVLLLRYLHRKWGSRRS